MSLYGSETKYKPFWLIWIASIALTFLVGAGVYFGLLELRKANSRKIGKENAVETLTYLGASYSREGGWLTIDGNFFESKPIRFSDATNILALDDSLAVKLLLLALPLLIYPAREARDRKLVSHAISGHQQKQSVVYISLESKFANI